MKVSVKFSEVQLSQSHMESERMILIRTNLSVEPLEARPERKLPLAPARM